MFSFAIDLDKCASRVAPDSNLIKRPITRRGPGVGPTRVRAMGQVVAADSPACNPAACGLAFTPGIPWASTAAEILEISC